MDFAYLVYETTVTFGKLSRYSPASVKEYPRSPCEGELLSLGTDSAYTSINYSQSTYNKLSAHRSAVPRLPGSVSLPVRVRSSTFLALRRKHISQQHDGLSIFIKRVSNDIYQISFASRHQQSAAGMCVKKRVLYTCGHVNLEVIHHCGWSGCAVIFRLERSDSTCRGCG